jgi:hypothetical protein
VVATLALFVALGGGAYAAIVLPRDSVGSAQIKPNAVDSGKVRDGSLSARDFKQGQLRPGPRGLTGQPGPTGPQGPGTVSLDGQFAASATGTDSFVDLGNNLRMELRCSTTFEQMLVQGAAFERDFNGWGTMASDGKLSVANVYVGVPGFNGASVTGATNVDLDIVAEAPPAGTVGQYSRLDLNAVLKSGICTYHALITPPQ